MKIDPGGVAALARGAGFEGEALRVAVAVSFAENGSHDTAAMGDVGIQTGTWGPSVGLWQIRSAKAETGKGTSRDASKLTDPAFNAKSAFTISNGGKNWTPWSTFKDGSYRTHLAEADEAIKAAPATDLASLLRRAAGIPDLSLPSLSLPGLPNLDIGASISRSVNAVTGSLFKAGLNIGALLLALVLMGLGVMILLHDPIRRATLGVAKGAAAVAPQGKVARVAGKAAKIV